MEKEKKLPSKPFIVRYTAGKFEGIHAQVETREEADKALAKAERYFAQESIKAEAWIEHNGKKVQPCQEEKQKQKQPA